MMNSAELSLIVTVAAVTSAGITLVLRPWLQRYLLAHPNSRSSHRQSTPQGGGIAVIAAALAVAACAATISLNEPASLWLLFAATAFLMLVGAADDLWTIEVVPRLLLQTVAVGFMLASLPEESRLAPMLPWWAERVLLLLACLWFVNLANF